jgi:homoserine/homoserine lactone efflux protein
MDIWVLILFVATEFMFSLSPGPAVVGVVSSSILGGYRLAVFAILGVLVANLLYFLLSASIIIAGTSVNEEYFYYIKVAGCAYLVVLLFRQYFSVKKSNPDGKDNKVNVVNSASHKLKLRQFLLTFVMQMANPKTILFFTAFLPQFINTDYNLIVQFLILATLSFITEFIVLIAYAAGGQVMLKYGSEKFGEYANHIGNVIMIIAVVWSFLR